ncbi:MAG: hypothetical protein GY884_21010 [Proteobacteria bacterium]|nr:hypothetical protein [Pseudomonadota bacterium]
MDARLLEFGRRHQARLEALAGVRRVQRELGNELRRTLADQAGPPRRPSSVWDKVRALFVVEAPPAVAVDAVWAHHEAATRAVRAVHHHTELLALDLELVDRDLAEMRATWSRLNRASAGRAYTTDEERFRDLLGLVDQLRDRLVQLLDDLRQVDAAGRAALEAMDLHISWLRETEGASSRDPRDLERMRRSMQWVCTLAAESGRHVEEHEDAMAARLAAIDAESAERRRALRQLEEELERS